jgi:membrane-associated protease RseP (regulator of RpoE activity)
MQERPQQFSAHYSSLTALLTFAAAMSFGGIATAEDEPGYEVEWVALAEDAAPSGNTEPSEKRIIQHEIRRNVGSGVVGEEDVDVLFFNFRRGDDGGRFWIGVECHEAAPELRAQLGLEGEQGLVVVRVSDDSAAAKAGVKRHDVVVAAGDSKLSRVPDLAKAVNAAEGKAVKLKIIRAGKEQSIDVTPTERPGDVVKYIARPHIGMFVPSAAAPMGTELPDNMTIKIERQGKKPATIVVTRGDEKFETSEEHLDKLPEDVRQLVARSLGGPWTIPMPPGKVGGAFGIATPPMMHIEAMPEGGATPGKRVTIKAVVPGGNQPGAGGARAFNGPVPPLGNGPHAAPLPPGIMPGEASLDIMKRLEMLDRRLEQMQDEIRRLRDERQGGAKFERRIEPRGGQVERRDDGEHKIEIEIDDRPVPRPSR